MAGASGTSPVCLVIWSVWSISFVWLNETNQMNQINQMNQKDETNQTNQSNQSGLALHASRSLALADFFSSLLVMTEGAGGGGLTVKKGCRSRHLFKRSGRLQ